MNSDFGDYDNDGDLDFFLTHFDQYVELHTNIGDGTFIKSNLLEGVIDSTRGGAWFDYDNDGDLDIIIQGEWFSSQHDYLLVTNGGNGLFTSQVFLPAPTDERKGRPAALADINNDGFIDMFIAFYTDQRTGIADLEQDRLWINDGNDNHRLKLDLGGTSSNSSGVGAIVRVKATINGEEVWQMRQITAGGTLFVQHDMRPNFGLGDATVAEVVRIEWPSGLIQEMENVAADQILQVVEPSGVEPPQLSIKPAIILSWPIAADGYVLYGADSLNGPWMMIDEPIEVEGGQSTVTVTVSEQMQFYQLQMP